MATYKKGSRSDEVKRIQEALGIEADGIYGSNTERAVRNYQQQNGLKVDGIVGNNTWGSLFGGSSGGWGPITPGFSASVGNTGIPGSGRHDHRIDQRRQPRRHGLHRRHGIHAGRSLPL